MNAASRRALLTAALLGACAGTFAQEPEQAPGTQAQTQNQVYGWQLMTPRERLQYQQRLRSLGDPQRQARYRSEHRRLMEERARQMGVAVPPANASNLANPPAGFGPPAGGQNGSVQGRGSR